MTFLRVPSILIPAGSGDKVAAMLACVLEPVQGLLVSIQ
jgi:hypothetical protein